MKDNLNISESELSQIDDYLNGRMTAVEIEEFQDQIDKDEELKSKVEELRDIHLGIESSVIKKKMEAFHKDFEKDGEEIEPKIVSFQWYHLLAAALFVIAAGSYWFTGNEQEQLFDTYFTPDPGLPTPMSNTQNYEFYKGMVSYKEGKYDSAIKQWKLLLEADTKNDTLNYFLGVAQLANGNELEAIEYLNKVSEKGEFVFSDETSFYLGLSYLKVNEKEKAKEALKNSRATESKALLRELQE